MSFAVLHSQPAMRTKLNFRSAKLNFSNAKLNFRNAKLNFRNAKFSSVESVCILRPTNVGW